MKLVRLPKKIFSTIIYIDSTSELQDNFILSVSKYSDVFVYISNKSKIVPIKYCLSLPITGFCSGSNTEVPAVREVIRDLIAVLGKNSTISSELILLNTDTSASSPYVQGDLLSNFVQYYMENPQARSIRRDLLTISDTRYQDRSEMYKKGYNLMKNSDLKGSFTTKVTYDSIMILSMQTYINLLKWEESVSKSEILSEFSSSFSNSRISEYIPSLFNWSDTKYPNYSIYKYL